MPKKTSVNKSEEIRQILSQNLKTPVKEVISTLSAKGIKVRASLVYAIKTKMKHRKRKQLRQNVAKVSPNGNPVQLIRAVKSLAVQAGGMRNLKELVEALNE
jgi:hypothetical protein